MQIHNAIPKSLFQVNGSNPTTSTFGTQPDISSICQFDWYKWCYVRQETNTQFPFQKEVLGQVLGPCKNEGNEMIQNIPMQNGKIVPRRTCRPLTLEEQNSKAEQDMRNAFDRDIKEKLGDSITIVHQRS